MNQNNNLDLKYIKCAGCSKPPHLRRENGSVIIPFKGRNGEELCHKCAPCAKCGKEACGESFNKYEKTNDNPSGEWVLAHCSIECFNGTEKSSLPKKAPEKFHLNANCDHCGKWSEIKVGNASWGKSFCSGNCYELAFARVPTSQSDEIGAHCCVCGFRIFSQDGNYAEDFENRKDKKLHFSDRNFHARYCSESCFEKRGEKIGASCKYENGSLKYNHGSTESGNSPKPNPAAPSSQPITNPENKDNQSDNSVKVNPGSSPKPNLGKDNSSEIRISLNQAEEPKNNPGEKPQNEANKDNNQILVINLKDIKQISLIGDNLVIEFNQSEQTQMVVSEQITNNRELSAVKNYLQSSHRSSVNCQELANIISQKTTDNSNANSQTQPSKSPFLWIAGVGAIGIMTGLCCGLVIKVKKLRSKKK